MILIIKKSTKRFFIFSFNNRRFFLQNINTKLFPSDFFEPILPKEEKKLLVNNKNNFNLTKSTYISLQKEYDEDKELLDLLTPSKRNSLYYNIYFYSTYK